ncbi:MAG TPA: SDR family oxidoreductase [Pyrinomonadaceae bacterium]|jgi:NAD(P)-dependent dehydrogenase (short-subunit alcohol dehydrogenase family)|nr:SDR family oxidoreductase [Pyrinomonadaceae bacterium]
MKSLEGKVAVVAGATRGAGRGIACMLGEAGAVVYCTGRSTRGRPNMTGALAGRPENIDETAEMVSARGGRGVPVRTDHSDESQVEALFKRVAEEHGRLDVLVNDISEGVRHEWKPFWKLSVEHGLLALRQGIDTHIITTRHAAPLMVKQKSGLIVEIGDGDGLYHRGNLFYDLIKITVSRLAYAWAEELHPHRVASLALTPGFMRTETVLDTFGATEENWREVAEKNRQARGHGFAGSESPFFVGRAVAALAADPKVLDKSGGLYSSWGLSEEYGYTDIDGARPHWWTYFSEHFPQMVNAKPNTGLRWKIEKG